MTTAPPTTPPAFVIDADYVDRVYHELGAMSVELDDDPLEFGPRRLSEKLAKVRGMLDRCERVFIQVSYDLHRFRRQHRIENTTLELEIRRMMAVDPETRAGRAVKDRVAIAKTKLLTEVSSLDNLESGILEFEGTLVVIKAKRADLKDTSGRLRDQIRLCRDEIEHMSARWGTRRPGAPALTPGLAPNGVDAVDALLAPAHHAIASAQADGTWVEPDEFVQRPDLDVDNDDVLDGFLLDDDADDEDNIGGLLGLAASVLAGDDDDDDDDEPEPVADVEPEPVAEPDVEPEPEPVAVVAKAAPAEEPTQEPAPAPIPLVPGVADGLEFSANPEEVDAFLDSPDDDDGRPGLFYNADDDDDDLDDILANF